MLTLVTQIQSLVEYYVPKKSEGQGMVEYGLILVLVALAVIVLLTALGDGIGGVFEAANAALGGAVGGDGD